MQSKELNSLKIKEWCRSQPKDINENLDPKVLANDLEISLEECYSSLDEIVDEGYAEKYIDIECPNLECRYINSIDASLINERNECQNEDCKMTIIPEKYLEDKLQGIYYQIDEEYYKVKEATGLNLYKHLDTQSKNEEKKIITLIDNSEKGSSVMSEKERKIFISHCSENREVADLIFQLIKDMKVDFRKVYYSSSEETGAKLFGDCLKSIEEQFNEYELTVIFIVSKEFNKSQVCLAETGATWVTCKDRYIPIILPPFDYENLGGVINSNQNSILLSDGSLDDKLDNLKRTIESFMNIGSQEQIQDSEWKAKKSEFINKIKNYIDNIHNIDSKIQDLNIYDKEVIFNITINNNTKQRRKIGELNITILTKDEKEIKTEVTDEKILDIIALKPLSSMNICLKATMEEAVKVWQVDKEKCIIDVKDYTQE